MDTPSLMYMAANCTKVGMYMATDYTKVSPSAMSASVSKAPEIELASKTADPRELDTVSQETLHVTPWRCLITA